MIIELQLSWLIISRKNKRRYLLRRWIWSNSDNKNCEKSPKSLTPPNYRWERLDSSSRIHANSSALNFTLNRVIMKTHLMCLFPTTFSTNSKRLRSISPKTTSSRLTKIAKGFPNSLSVRQSLGANCSRLAKDPNNESQIHLKITILNSKYKVYSHKRQSTLFDLHFPLSSSWILNWLCHWSDNHTGPPRHHNEDQHNQFKTFNSWTASICCPRT